MFATGINTLLNIEDAIVQITKRIWTERNAEYEHLSQNSGVAFAHILPPVKKKPISNVRKFL